MKTVRALVLHGYGINCEREMAHAAQLAGAEVRCVHAKAWLAGQVSILDYDLPLLPGGFSFGDELGAAKAFANRIKFSKRRDDLLSLIEKGKCILGVCNGFQLLIKLGILPGWREQPHAALIQNRHGKFESRWVHHHVLPTHCVFTMRLQELYLPIRHGEGNFIIREEGRLFSGGHATLQYANSDNPNGSQASVAGICDHTGRVFGMMAHPEAALYFMQLPDWTRRKEMCRRHSLPLPEYGPGLAVFKNAVNYLRLL